MWALRTGTKAWLLSSALLFSGPLLAENAEAAQHGHAHGGASHPTIRPTASLHAHPISSHTTYRMTYMSGARLSHAIHRGGLRFAARSYGISCVPYAREASGIMIPGNAWQWWDNAEGLYARGSQPESGSVLNFRANGRMRLGHVAVVARVVNAREVFVDHANWPGGGGRGGVSQDVAVVDVSEANDWSAVRVELGHGGEFGSVYPTYGFIYNRPDRGIVTASVTRPAQLPALNSAPADLRPAAQRPWHTVEEVAEAPIRRTHHRIDMRITTTPISFGK